MPRTPKDLTEQRKKLKISLVKSGMAIDKAENMITGIEKAVDRSVESVSELITGKPKEGRRFKYSRPDGAIDVERIDNILDAYFYSKDREAKEKAYKKLTKEEKDRTDIDDMPVEGSYTIAGMCVALEVDRSTLNLWERGLTSAPKYDQDGNDVSAYDEELSATIKKAKSRVYEGLEEMRNGNNIMSIFLLKNHAGYADKTESEVNVSGSIRFEVGQLKEYSD